ncbi:retrovirus-related pol polyprotein from transposon TNT 1-94 [Tanacetum coccineum]
MTTMAENVIAEGTENRPSMLDKGMYDSWKTHIWLYIKRKENGEMSINSIEKRPFQLKKKIANRGVNGGTDEKRAQTDRVKELMEDTKLKLEERKSKLYDEFDKFTFELGETIHSYYWRYSKLINDMNIIGMTMKKIQVNKKFVNNLQLEWSRFVTTAKQAKDLHTINFDQLYAFLKHYEHDANENIQGHQSQGYGVDAGKSQATGTRGVNTVSDVNANQSRVIRCYNCKGKGHTAKQCTTKKMVKDSKWFKQKMLLAKAQESGVVLHEDQQEFFTDRSEEMDSDYDDL